MTKKAYINIDKIEKRIKEIDEIVNVDIRGGSGGAGSYPFSDLLKEKSELQKILKYCDYFTKQNYATK